MDTSDVTVEILRSIRDEIRHTNERLDQTNQGLDATRSELSERLDATRSELGERLERLERRQTETEVRLATELAAVAHAVTDVRDLLRDRLDLRDDVAALDRRLTVVEQRLGG
ncbi:MAG: hypothetical protein HY906_25465 [Deltaproteobacteria bacterium]|nr:hypothetical protein [Deltaproteobacteria bacterium]